MSIPPNTGATVYVPAQSPDEVSESGQPVGQSAGVELLRTEPGRVVLKVSSGDYAFASAYTPDPSDPD